MTVLRVCYKSGIRFDEAYYKGTHLPFVGSVMGPYGVSKIEMVKVRSMIDGSKPSYQVIFTAYFDSPASLQDALASPKMPDVLADIGKFHDGTPDVFIGEVVEGL